MLDIIIKNGIVYDGAGNPPTKLEVGIKDGKIVKIDNLINEEAKNVINAKELAISPGFIDTHSHCDLYCVKPDIYKIRTLQGITTELLGQDGISVAPVSDDTKPLWQKQLKALNGDIGDWPWEDIEQYLKYLESQPIVGNLTYLVPHGNVRSLVMGFEQRIATEKELLEMQKLVEIGLKQGATGVSSGLVYPPNVYSNTKELIAICEVAAKYNKVFVVHIRNESANALVALEEMLDVARATGVRLHISHFKVAGKINRDKYKQFLVEMDKAREEGIEITFDQYPYTAGSTVFHGILPPWMHAGGTKEMLERLKDETIREQIKHEFRHNKDYENWVLNCGWENIIINSVSTEKNKDLIGLNMIEISSLRNINPDEMAINLLLEEDANVNMTVHWGVEEDLIYGMKHPLQMVGSDGIFGDKPHPRLYGTFSRVLGKYARNKKIFDISEAIRKMTSAPAQLLRLKNRGLIREGNWADIVIFDPKTIKDTATYQDPLQTPNGIFYVLINGKLVVENGDFNGETPGKVIRK